MRIRRIPIHKAKLVLKEKLTNELVKKIFQSCTAGEIYVVDNQNILEGIITRGDYERSNGGDLNCINTKFKRVYDTINQIYEAKQIFEKYPNINSIPVLGDNGELVQILKSDDDIDDFEYVGQLIYVIENQWNIYRFFTSSGYYRIGLYGDEKISSIVKRQLEKSDEIQVTILTCEEDIEVYNLQYVVIVDEESKEIAHRCWEKFLTEKGTIVSLKELLECIISQKSGNYGIVKKLLDLKERGSKCYLVRLPSCIEMGTQITDAEKTIIEYGNNPGRALSRGDVEYLNSCYVNGESKDEIKELMEVPPLVMQGERMYHSDFKNKVYEIKDGTRKTLATPTEYSRVIHIFGDSRAFSWGVSDNDTFENYLQKTLNEQYPNTYKVINYGVCTATSGHVNKVIDKIDIKDTDIVIYLNTIDADEWQKWGISYIDALELIKEKKGNEQIFLDNVHYNVLGNKIVSDIIFEKIILAGDKNQIEMNSKGQVDIVENKEEECKYIEDYNKINAIKNSIDLLRNKGPKIGAIVMNANPFTLGHRYLVEYAAKQVDVLYVFVVEEDKSYFKFQDRINLVRLGTQDIKNVWVIESGDCIASNAILPQYFIKSEYPDVILNCNKDLEMFGKYVAPALNISVRFVGEEPIDKVTRQYNYKMRYILQNKYNVEVVEIKRLCKNEQIVSASKVRKLLSEKRFDKIREIVPETTYQFLIENYK